jgi:hypothetical protein
MVFVVTTAKEAWAEQGSEILSRVHPWTRSLVRAVRAIADELFAQS